MLCHNIKYDNIQEGNSRERDNINLSSTLHNYDIMHPNIIVDRYLIQQGAEFLSIRIIWIWPSGSLTVAFTRCVLLQLDGAGRSHGTASICFVFMFTFALFLEIPYPMTSQVKQKSSANIKIIH